MAEGYVVFDPVLRMYYQGDTVISEEYDNVRLWTPGLSAQRSGRPRKAQRGTAHAGAGVWWLR